LNETLNSFVYSGIKVSSSSCKLILSCIKHEWNKMYLIMVLLANVPDW